MELDIILENMLPEELSYFYHHIREYDDTRKIDIAIFEDVYASALEYNLCETQREAILRMGEELNNLNGTVFFRYLKKT